MSQFHRLSCNWLLNQIQSVPIANRNIFPIQLIPASHLLLNRIDIQVRICYAQHHLTETSVSLANYSGMPGTTNLSFIDLQHSTLSKTWKLLSLNNIMQFATCNTSLLSFYNHSKTLKNDSSYCNTYDTFTLGFTHLNVKNIRKNIKRIQRNPSQ